MLSPFTFDHASVASAGPSGRAVWPDAGSGNRLAGSNRSARLTDNNAPRSALFTRFQLPPIKQPFCTEQGSSAPSTQAVRAIGPSIASTTSAMLIWLTGRASWQPPCAAMSLHQTCGHQGFDHLGSGRLCQLCAFGNLDAGQPDMLAAVQHAQHQDRVICQTVQPKHVSFVFQPPCPLSHPLLTTSPS